MATFMVRARPAAATAATADTPIVALFNPVAGGRRIRVHQVSVSANIAPAANCSFYLRRLTDDGTPTATVTPDAANALDVGDDPASDFVIDTAWSVAPTAAGTALVGATMGAVAGSMAVIPLRGAAGAGLELLPGEGIAFYTGNAVAFPVSDWNFVVEE